MTPEYCLKALADEIRRAVQNFTLQAEYQADKPVTVYEQVVPASNFEQDTYYPLVWVEITDIVDNSEFSELSILITIGVYMGEDDKGYLDLLNLTEAIRQMILTKPLIGNAMLFDYPLQTQFDERRGTPFGYSYLNCKYQVVRPVPKIDDVF